MRHKFYWNIKYLCCLLCSLLCLLSMCWSVLWGRLRKAIRSWRILVVLLRKWVKVKFRIMAIRNHCKIEWSISHIIVITYIIVIIRNQYKYSHTYITEYLVSLRHKLLEFSQSRLSQYLIITIDSLS